MFVQLAGRACTTRLARASTDLALHEHVGRSAELELLHADAIHVRDAIGHALAPGIVNRIVAIRSAGLQRVSVIQQCLRVGGRAVGNRDVVARELCGHLQIETLDNDGNDGGRRIRRNGVGRVVVDAKSGNDFRGT